MKKGSVRTMVEATKKASRSRESMIAAASGTGVVLNILIAAAKIAVGLLASSVAIVTEGANNAADALTSVLTFLGAKLAKKHPDAKHPFGYGRIEYLASLVISVLILVTGVEMLVTSVKSAVNPEELEVSVLSLAVLGVTAVVKFFLGVYMIRVGKRTDSGALVGVGTENRNDSFASAITIVSSALFLATGISLDAYAGIVISFLLLKTGFDVLRGTVSDLLGRPGEKELAEKLYEEIRDTDGVLAAADMMLHNYGPTAWSGSVNLEIDRKMTVGEVYGFLHALQLRIMQTYSVTMVFGIYAVDEDREESRELRKTIAAFTRTQEHVKSYHAVYCDRENGKIYCDFIVDYSLRDWDELQSRFESYMREVYPDFTVVLTVETEFV